MSASELTIRYVDGRADCGFGHGVYANGTYDRTSRSALNFDQLTYTSCPSFGRR